MMVSHLICANKRKNSRFLDSTPYSSPIIASCSHTDRDVSRDCISVLVGGNHLEGNQNKNNCLVSNFYNKLEFPALFSVRNRLEKSAGKFDLL